MFLKNRRVLFSVFLDSRGKVRFNSLNSVFVVLLFYKDLSDRYVYIPVLLLVLVLVLLFLLFKILVFRFRSDSHQRHRPEIRRSPKTERTDSL